MDMSTLAITMYTHVPPQLCAWRWGVGCGGPVMEGVDAAVAAVVVVVVGVGVGVGVGIGAGMTITPSPGDATPSAPQAARMEQATPLSMTKRTRAKAAMKISVPGARPPDGRPR